MVLSTRDSKSVPAVGNIQIAYLRALAEKKGYESNKKKVGLVPSGK